MAGLARVAVLLAALPVVARSDALPSAARADREAPAEEALAADDQCGDGSCALSALQLRTRPRRQAGNASEAGNASASRYALTWEASGDAFFEDWTFVTDNLVHGAQQYEAKAEALRDGLAYTQNGTAIIRVGGLGSQPYTRKSVRMHTNHAWSPQQSFVALLRYEHLPFGCSVWPSFWSVNSDRVWPGGGELDILEYANAEGSSASFHTSHPGCYVQTWKVYQKIFGGDMPRSADCLTDYWNAAPKMGCRPSQHSHSGDWWSGNPGIVGAEWTAEHVKVFHIPEDRIPEDIHSGNPEPGTWDRFLIAYLPFSPGCAAAAQPQELILNIQLCGDWAGHAWHNSCHAAHSSGCTNDIFDPPNDCCTQFMMSPHGKQTMKHAYFAIKSLKVFTPPGTIPHLSGTYMRGGAPLKAPR